jgi:hypothetical protein
MSETFFIRPAHPQADIRDPETGERLPAAGIAKPRTPYWIGLQIREDVLLGPPPKVKADKAV